MDKLHAVLADVVAEQVVANMVSIQPDTAVERIQAMIDCLDASPQPVYDQLCEDSQFWPERTVVIQYQRAETMDQRLTRMLANKRGYRDHLVAVTSTALHGGPSF